MTDDPVRFGAEHDPAYADTMRALADECDLIRARVVTS